MKTWYSRRGRNIFWLSFGWENLKNVKEQPSVFIPTYVGLGLHAQTCSCVCSLDWCICRLILACMYLFFSLCAHKFHTTYACRILHTQACSCIHMAPSRNPSLGILVPFSPVFHLFATLTSSFTIFCTQLYVPCHISSYCASNITFSPFLLLGFMP